MPKPKLSLLLLLVGAALVALLGSQSSQAEARTNYIVPGGLWTQEDVLEAAASNPQLHEALKPYINPEQIVEVKEIVYSGFRQTVDVNLEPSRLWIRDGEAVWQLTDASGSSTVVKKQCGNPPVVQPPPPPAPKKGAIVQVRKECGPENGPFGPCGEWKAVRVEAKAIGRELWIVDPRSSAVAFDIPAEWFEERDELELTVSEEPKPGWTPKVRWQVVRVKPGETVIVTFRNIAPAPPEDGDGPPGPSPTPTPGPNPTPTPEPSPTPEAKGCKDKTHDCGHGNNLNHEDADNPGKAPFRDEAPPDTDERGGEPGGASHSPDHPSGGNHTNTGGGKK